MATASNIEECEKTSTESKRQASPFDNPSDTSDLILLVEEENLHVSKLVLSLASPVFQRMFKTDIKGKERKEISLPDKKFADVLEFLLCIYPSTCKPVNVHTLDVVLPIAHEYQVQQLVDRCEMFVLTRFKNAEEELRNPPIKDLVHYLFLADKYGLQQLLKLCIEKMVLRNYLTGSPCAMDVDEFKLVSVKTRYEILEGRMRLLEPIARQQHETSRIKDFRDCFLFSMPSNFRSISSYDDDDDSV